jgi:hypothetical protein
MARDFRDFNGIPVRVSGDLLCQDGSWLAADSVPRCWSSTDQAIFLDYSDGTAREWAFVHYYLTHDGQDPPPNVPVDQAATAAELDAARQALLDEIAALSVRVNSVGGDVTNSLSTLLNQFNNALDPTSGAVQNALSRRLQGIDGNINSVSTDIQALIMQATSGTVDAINASGTAVQQAVTAANNEVASRIGDAQFTIQAGLTAEAASIDQSIGTVGQQVQSAIGGELDAIHTAITSVAGAVVSGIEGTAGDTLSNINDTLNTTSRNIQDAINNAKVSFPTPGELWTGLASTLDSKYSTLRDRVQDVFKVSLPPALRDALDLLEGEAAEPYDSIVRSIVNTYPLPPEIQQALAYSGRETHATGLLTKLFGLSALIDIGMHSVLEPATRSARQASNSIAQNEYPPFDAMVQGEWRGLVTADDVRKVGRALGYSDAWTNMQRAVVRPLLSPLEYIRLWRRGEMGEFDLHGRLAKIGLDDDTQAMLKVATQYVPTTTDVLVWLTRDVFIPEFRDRFGMDLEFPADALPFFAAVGISEQNARNFWAAHWELPSITQGYEMYQRTSTNDSVASGESITLPNGNTVKRVIGAEDIRRLLRAKGIEPFWREKVLAISFNPFTRIDLRRMHKLGILSDSDVYRGYLDIGYDADHAQRLMEFTVSLNRSEVAADSLPWRTSLKSKIVSAFEAGALDEQDTRSHLEAIDFTASQIDFFIAESAFNVAVRNETGLVNAVKPLYVDHLWTADQATAELQAAGIPASQITTLLHEWSIDAQFKDMTAALKHNKELTKAEIEAAYSEQAVTREDALAMLESLGYDATESALLLAQVDYRIVKATRQEVQDAAKALYLDGQIERPEASRRLDTINLSATQRDALLDLWSVQRETKRPHIPLGLIEKMVADAIIDHDAANAELMRQHYTVDQARLLLALWGDEIAKAQAAQIRQESERQAAEQRRQAAQAMAAAARQSPTRVQLTQKQISDLLGSGAFTLMDARVQLLLNRTLPADVERLLQRWAGEHYVAPNLPLASIESEVRRIFGDNFMNLRADPIGTENELRRVLNA